jgi:hypothetical protein
MIKCMYIYDILMKSEWSDIVDLLIELAQTMIVIEASSFLEELRVMEE